jgi:hypothetical protein
VTWFGAARLVRIREGFVAARCIGARFNWRRSGRWQVNGLGGGTRGDRLGGGGPPVRTLRFAASGGGGALRLHEFAAELEVGLVLVVRVTEKPHAVDGGLAAVGDRRGVVELEKRLSRATDAVGTQPRALLAVAVVDVPAHAARDVAGVGVGPAFLRLAGTGGRTELRRLDLREQRVEGRVEDDGEVTGRIGVPHEVSGAFELVARGLVDRHLQREALGGEGFHACRRRRGCWIRIQLEHPGRGVGRHERPDRGRQIGSRREARDEDLEIGLAAVRGGGHDLVDVLLREVRAQHHDARDMEAAVGDRLEQLRKPAREASGADALEGHFAVEVQRAGAVRVHRWERRRQEELARIDLREVREQLRGVLAIAPDQSREVSEQLRIVDVIEGVRAHDLP